VDGKRMSECWSSSPHPTESSTFHQSLPRSPTVNFPCFPPPLPFPLPFFNEHQRGMGPRQAHPAFRRLQSCGAPPARDRRPKGSPSAVSPGYPLGWHGLCPSWPPPATSCLLPRCKVTHSSLPQRHPPAWCVVATGRPPGVAARARPECSGPRGQAAAPRTERRRQRRRRRFYRRWSRCWRGRWCRGQLRQQREWPIEKMAVVQAAV